MAFTSSVVFSVDVPAVVDSVVIGSVVAGGAVGANDAANVEGTAVVTVGMAVSPVLKSYNPTFVCDAPVIEFICRFPTEFVVLPL